MALQLEAAPIDDQLRAFVDAGLDPVLHALLVRGIDDRAIMRLGIGGDTDAQRLDSGEQLFLEPLGGILAHRHDHRQCHAALSGRPIGRTAKIADHLIEIGIGHHDTVVLRAAHGLHALARRDAALIDIMRNVRTADEADSADRRMIEDGVDHLLVALHHLQNAFRRARFQKQFGQTARHAGVALAGLQDEGVACRDGGAEHPHRDHRGEVERRDARADAERLAHRIDIDTGAGALGIFALEHMRNAAAEFDHVEPALHITARIRDYLAMLGTEHFGEVFHVRFDQFLELEEDARTALRIGRGPFGLRGMRRGHGLVEQRGIAQRHLRLHAAVIGIEHIRCA